VNDNDRLKENSEQAMFRNCFKLAAGFLLMVAVACMVPAPAQEAEKQKQRAAGFSQSIHFFVDTEE
jgi:hypothetical protein